jgi:SAM-dependent methyltransferase
MPSAGTTDESPRRGASHLPDTGERLHTDVCDDNTLEHLHRYGLALDFCRGRRVLDIASGEGYGSNLLASVAESVRGVDISDEAVSHARLKYGRPNLEYLQGSADAIPLPDASIDTVVSFETIEHHDRHAEMLAEIKRVLRPNGVLVISSPDKLNYTDIPGVINPFHVKELYREEFHALVRANFVNVWALSQRVVYGSLVAPEGGTEGFREYWGSFEEVHAERHLRSPMYNLCVASDAELPPMHASYYDGQKVFEAVVEDVRLKAARAVMESRAYRLGRALTWPARVLLGRGGE